MDSKTTSTYKTMLEGLSDFDMKELILMQMAITESMAKLLINKEVSK